MLNDGLWVGQQELEWVHNLLILLLMKNIKQIARNITAEIKVKEWTIQVQKSNELYSELKKSIATHDDKKILDAQLKLVDHYNIPRSSLIHLIREISPDKVQQILNGGSVL